MEFMNPALYQKFKDFGNEAYKKANQEYLKRREELSHKEFQKLVEELKKIDEKYLDE